jgi:hypothetical protein
VAATVNRSRTGLDDEEDEEFKRARGKSEKMAEKAAVLAGGSPGVQRPISYDPRHLKDTTPSEFGAQQQGQQGEKKTQNKTEKILMEYVKEQSLLEVQHQNKGNGRATAIEDKDNEDMQKALKLSMPGHGVRYGEASWI